MWSVALLVLILLAVAAPARALPSPTFVACFDGTLEARGPAGMVKPLSVEGEPRFERGRLGQALVAGTRGAAVEYPAPGHFSPSEGTLSLWVCPVDWQTDDGVFHVFFEAGHAEAGWVVLYKYYQGGLLFRPQNETKAASYPRADVSTWKPGEWHHVAATWRDAELRLFVDGELSAEEGRTFLPQSIGDRFRLGDLPWHLPRDRRTLLDEVGIYDRVLSPADIRALARAWRLRVDREPLEGRWLVRILPSWQPAPEEPVRAGIRVTGPTGEAVHHGQTEGQGAEGGSLVIATRGLPPGEYQVTADFDGTSHTVSVPRRAEEVITLANSQVALRFDAVTGGLLGVEDARHATPLRRERRPEPVFKLHCVSFDRYSRFFPEDAWQILSPDASTARECSVRREGARQTLTQIHEFAPSIWVMATVALADEAREAEWRITVENRPPQRPSLALLVHAVTYPILSGVSVGPPEATRLVQPIFQGSITRDPLANAPSPSVLSYLGNASMSWLDLYTEQAGGPALGLYLGSHDPRLPQTELEFIANRDAGHMSLAIRRWTFLWPDERWEGGPCVSLVHEGDWHRAADRYRAYFREVHGAAKIPQWVREADGWFGCGGPTYTFADLPRVLDEAERIGLNYLQMWSEMTGGDEGYQTYLFPNPTMGSPATLKRAIATLHRRGAHIGFYLNYCVYDATLAQYLARDKFRAAVAGQPQTFEWKHGWQDAAIIGPEGRYRHAGAPGLDAYADGYWAACPAARIWQDYAVYWIVQRWAREYGADAWYLDSVPPGYPYYAGTTVCFNTDHGHRRPQGVNVGVLEAMRRIRSGGNRVRPFGLLNEGVCDLFMKHTTHVLGTELAGWSPNPSPEVFTYTFPDFLIFSGTANTWAGVQNYYPGEKVAHEDAFDRVHLMGFRFDVLGLYPPRPEQDPLRDYLRRLIGLRKRVKADLYASDFRDTDGLGALPPRVAAKVFRRRDGKALLVSLLDRREVKAPFSLEVHLPSLGVQSFAGAMLHTLDGEAPVEVKPDGERLVVTVPAYAGRPAMLVLGGPSRQRACGPRR